MISKNLLSEVLNGVNVTNIRVTETIVLFQGTGIWDIAEINIYELQHKIKEWAFSNGYYIRAEQGTLPDPENQFWAGFVNVSMQDGCNFSDYYSTTEFEAVVKAADYILEKLESKLNDI